MSNTLNKVNSMVKGETFTHEGGKAYSISFNETIAEFFSLGLLNGTFYESETEVLKNAKDLFERALKECPEFATKAAIYGNNVNSLKLVPTIWLVYLSTMEDKTLFKSAFDRIIRNPKMLYDFMEIVRKTDIRGGLGRSLKTTVNTWLHNNLNEYQTSRNKGKLSEIVNVCRPSFKEDSTFQAYMKYLMRNELTFNRAIALKRVIEILQNGTYTVEASELIKNNKLQLEELKHSTGTLDDVSKKNLYMDIYRELNYAALILNLVALERVYAKQTSSQYKLNTYGNFNSDIVIETLIPDELIEIVVNKIKDVDLYHRSNMLPFALYNASKMVVTPEFKAAISDIFKKVANESFKISDTNSVLVGVDTSASMDSNITGQISAVEVASLFGSMIKKSYSDANIYAVATLCKKVNIKAQDEIFSMSKSIQKTDVGCGTCFERILDKYNKEKYVIIITDSEQSDNFESIWRKTAKPKGAKVIVWQLRPNRQVISKDNNFIYLRGYSDRMLSLIKNIIESDTNQIEEIEKIKL